MKNLLVGGLKMFKFKSIKTLAEATVKSAKTHSPLLLNLAGAGFVISAIPVAIKNHEKYQTLRAATEHGKRMEGKPDTLTKKDVIVCAAKAYWPTCLLIAAGLGCFFGSSYILHSRVVSATAAAVASAAAYTELKDATREIASTEVQDAIDKKIAEANAKRMPEDVEELKSFEKKMTESEDSGQVFYEPYTGRYFQSTIQDIRAAINDINKDLNQGELVLLNDFFDLIGLESVDMGNFFVWTQDIEGQAWITWNAYLAPGRSKPCLTLDYKNGPHFDDKPF